MIYIDYTECIPKKEAKFHGGGNYGKRIINVLAQNGIRLTVLVPSFFEASTDLDKQIFSHKNVTVQKIESLTDLKITEPNSILMIPMIMTRRLTVIKDIKKNNPELQVYVTIHGIRRLDLRPDGMNAYYQSGIKRTMYLPKAWLKYMIYKAAYRHVFKKYLPMYDKVFTVSNDSMQKIQRLSVPKQIKPYYCGSINTDRLESQEVTVEKENFALFVSGGREEKNLLRTLIAFQQFKRNDKTGLKLIVTGISEQLKNNFLSCRKLPKDHIEDNIEFLEYVSDEKLNQLYQSCRFVLYPSKSEGFGLPLVEACYYGTPIVASSITAMPEVLGSTINYVDPYSVKSIESAITYLAGSNYDTEITKMQRKRDNVILNIKNSDMDFVTEFCRM